MSYFVSAFLFNKTGVPRAFLILVLGLTGLVLLPALCFRPGFGQHPPGLPRAFVDGTEPGWRPLVQEDFTNVNCDPETWTCVEWRHLRSGGNSGVFVWVSEEALKEIKPNELPKYGIEVQILDHGFAQQYEQRTGKKGDFFTTNGDIFAVGKSKLKPFPPTSPNGSRSFPRKQLSKGVGEWNHYYVRAINGEVRLWVNGEEVSGGTGAEPRTGYLCLESEGSPIDFRNLRIRELP
ncbi:MAG: DUF1080 domain-containing protein [Acidobacteria bacterium]|nr:MAG: DUF1080 domain-containing protein [Acidobacteriota bacterium]